MDGGNWRQGKSTSEYRVTLLTQLIAFILVMTGVFAPGEEEGLTEALTIIAGGLLSIYTGSVYIFSRTSLKKEQLKQQPRALEESQRG